jgi:eukaryotic-like serine/threonine-protein kinase
MAVVMYRPGWLVAGRYQLNARLATGGMGDVWSAHDDVLGRPVAVKLVKPEFADDPVFRQRLVAEARAAAAVADPHVVEIYDVGEAADADGRRISYIAMALVAGRPVSDLVAAGPLPPDQAADVVSQVATALSAAHASGVIHRDIKPANLMRSGAGFVTVLDFGIARATDAAALTATGQLVGTARYLAPELVAGQPATTATDVYALGVVAYQCLTGVPPFDAGSDVATALAHRDQPVPPLPDTIPAGLAAVVQACLAKDPAARPSAPAVAALTASYTQPSDGSTAVMPVPGPTGSTATEPLATVPDGSDSIPRWLESRRVLAVAAAVVGVIALIAVIGIATDGSSPATASGRHRGTSHPTASPHHARTVAVRASRYLGESYAVAAAQLSDRGLTPITTGAAVSPDAIVTDVSPVGAVHRGAAITLTLQQMTPVKRPVKPTPGKPDKVKPVKPVKPGKVPPGHAKHEGHGHGGKH